MNETTGNQVENTRSKTTDKLKQVARKLKRELAFYQRVLRHERTPRLPRLLLGLAIGYVLLPFDLIPDFIPVIGHLDDVIIVPLLVVLAMKLVPAEVLEECRHPNEPEA